MYEQHPKTLKSGYTKMCDISSNMLMEFGVLKLEKGMKFSEEKPLERAYLLIFGSLQIEYEGYVTEIERKSFLDDAPIVLHVPKNMKVNFTCLDDAEIAITATENENEFTPVLYDDVKNEFRGKGTMQETSTRIVRTAFDANNAPYSNLVLGEVVSSPGKWSSYPPHHHPQPEVYFYKTDKEQGYGHGECGESVYKIRNNGIMFISEKEVHAHAAAPGYPIWYLWVIRHLDGNPYITPIFEKEHLWLTDKNATFWGPKGE